MADQNKITFPLSKEDQKKVNKTSLAEKHDCSDSYVSRVLKFEEMPVKGKAKEILEDAIKIIEAY